MSEQGERPPARPSAEDDWWAKLYDDSAPDAGPPPAPTGDTLDDRLASAPATVTRPRAWWDPPPDTPGPVAGALAEPGRPGARPGDPDEPGASPPPAGDPDAPGAGRPRDPSRASSRSASHPPGTGVPRGGSGRPPGEASSGPRQGAGPGEPSGGAAKAPSDWLNGPSREASPPSRAPGNPSRPGAEWPGGGANRPAPGSPWSPADAGGSGPEPGPAGSPAAAPSPGRPEAGRSPDLRSPDVHGPEPVTPDAPGPAGAAGGPPVQAPPPRRAARSVWEPVPPPWLPPETAPDQPLRGTPPPAAEAPLSTSRPVSPAAPAAAPPSGDAVPPAAPGTAAAAPAADPVPRLGSAAPAGTPGARQAGPGEPPASPPTTAPGVRAVPAARSAAGGPAADPRTAGARPVVGHVGGGPPTYESEPTALPAADALDLDRLVADTVVDGARYGTYTLRAASVRGDSARFRGEPRSDALLTARFGSGHDALVLVAVAGGSRHAEYAHLAAGDACRWIGTAVGRSHARLGDDIRAGRRGDLRSGLHRLTDRTLGRLRARAAELGVGPEEYAAGLRCLLLSADPECRTRVFFGVGPGGLFRLRDGAWQDLEPLVRDTAPAGGPVVGYGSAPPEAGPEGDRLTMDLSIATRPPLIEEPVPPPADPFRFRASVARPGDTLLLCSSGLAEPLRGEPALAGELAARWQGADAPGMAEFLADTQVRVKGYADDRTAVAVWEA